MMLHINFFVQFPYSFFLLLRFKFRTLLNIGQLHGIHLLEPYLIAKLDPFKILVQLEELLVEFAGGVAYYVLDEIFEQEIFPF